jgi:hypothetical protein
MHPSVESLTFLWPSPCLSLKESAYGRSGIGEYRQTRALTVLGTKKQIMDPALEPGSFRDRHGRVFYWADKVFRGLSTQAVREWKALSTTTFFQRFVDQGQLVRTEQVDTGGPEELPRIAGWAAVLKHETAPFISYPYEWSFGMLKDAALLQLELLLAVLQEEMILKDAQLSISSGEEQWRRLSTQADPSRLG